jgi:hypothetical protein
MDAKAFQMHVPNHGEIIFVPTHGTPYLQFRACIVLQDMENNFRPVQELNNRDVSLFRPIPPKHY